jgi:hypothetical protein
VTTGRIGALVGAMKSILAFVSFMALLTPAPAAEPALRHVVCFKFKAEAKAGDIKTVETAFRALKQKIPQIAGLEWGTNNSPEGHNKGFTHCFIVTFKSEKDRDAYLPHAEHKAFVEVLKPILDEVFVIDFWAKE